MTSLPWVSEESKQALTEPPCPNLTGNRSKASRREGAVASLLSLEPMEKRLSLGAVLLLPPSLLSKKATQAQSQRLRPRAPGLGPSTTKTCLGRSLVLSWRCGCWSESLGQAGTDEGLQLGRCHLFLFLLFFLSFGATLSHAWGLLQALNSEVMVLGRPHGMLAIGAGLAACCSMTPAPGV